MLRDPCHPNPESLGITEDSSDLTLTLDYLTPWPSAHWKSIWDVSK